MWKVPLSLTAFVVFLTPAWPAEIAIPSYSASAGASVSTVISLSAQGAAVSALQFDLEYDGSLMGVTLFLAQPGKDSQKLLYTADLTPNKKRIIVIGPNNSPLYSDSLISALVNLQPAIPAGTYILKVSQVICSDSAGRSVNATGRSGSIVVQPSTAASSITPDGVLNSASLGTGAVAPGEIITLIGSSIGPAASTVNQGNIIATALGGTRLLFNDIAAPLLYASSGQINAVVPFGIAGTSTRLAIETKGQKGAEISIPVARTAPGIFTVDSSGSGPGAILNGDASLNSPGNPASRGSVVSLFATGAGQMNPPGIDALIVNGSALGNPIAPVSVQVGTATAEVLYAGSAPGLVSGALQVNFRIPDGIAPSLVTPLLLQIGSASSQVGVTVAVK